VAGLALAVTLALPGASVALAENIDPNDSGEQYAWSENAGWINAEPSSEGTPGAHVGDRELSGWMYAENLGWISLSCENTLSCGEVDYGVLNDGAGNLSGFAWSENAGWINFAPEPPGWGSPGVTVDSATGELSGYAWAENFGWISFSCANTTSCGVVDYRVRTGWICDPRPPPPPGGVYLEVTRQGLDARLAWEIPPEATGADVVRGSLNDLRNSYGNFAAATEACVDDDRTVSFVIVPEMPDVNDGYWFLVRSQNCGGPGTYDSGGPGQVASRDPQILPPSGCP
jgi:hypothetical protein